MAPKKDNSETKASNEAAAPDANAVGANAPENIGEVSPVTDGGGDADRPNAKAADIGVIDLGGDIRVKVIEPVRFGGRRYMPGARLKVDETTFDMLDEAGVIED